MVNELILEKKTKNSPLCSNLLAATEFEERGAQNNGCVWGWICRYNASIFTQNVRTISETTGAVITQCIQ